MRLIAHLVYASFALTVGPAFLGVIVAHVMSVATADSWLESHFRWQIRTFWVATIALLALLAAGFLLRGGSMMVSALTDAAAVADISPRLPGIVLWGMLLVLLWFWYRVGKGWLFLLRGKEVA